MNDVRPLRTGQAETTALTMPHERTSALVNTGSFLHKLASEDDACVPARIRKQARHLLQHYPTQPVVESLCKALPNLFQRRSSVK
jgi:hypothetical protein